MTDNIRTIFQGNINIIANIDKSVYFFRKQQHDIALGIIADSMGLIRLSIEAIIINKDYFNLVSTDSVMEMLSGILEAYKSQDYVLLADLLELQLISFLIGVQELIINKENINFNDNIYHENLNLLMENSKGLDRPSVEAIDPQALLREGYRVEFSSSGLMTLAARNGDASFYFHTNGRIALEAFMLARKWYRKEIKRYIIYGLAFGYHIIELLSLSDNSEIIIYEEDINVILLSCAFTRLKEIFDTGRVKLVYDPRLKELSKTISNIQSDEALYVHYPSYQNIRGVKERELLSEYVSYDKN